MYNLFFLKKLLEFVVLSSIIAIILQCPFIDILILENSITEFSVTEFFQGIFLALIAATFIHLSMHDPEIKYGMILIAAFFSCLLTRELDFITDQLTISWFHFVLPIVFYSLFFALRNKKSTLYGLAHFCKSESYYMMLCGVLTVFVFSRLIGMRILWQALLNESYLRVVKNAVEEGAELFGYTLCLISALKYARSK